MCLGEEAHEWELKLIFVKWKLMDLWENNLG